MKKQADASRVINDTIHLAADAVIVERILPAVEKLIGQVKL